jgi:hypothetical protein
MVVTVTVANAQDLSANDIMPGCKAYLAAEPPNPGTAQVIIFNLGACVVSVGSLIYLAIHADVSAAAFIGEGQSRAAKEHWRCLDIPQGITRAQAVRVVVA